MYHLHYDLFISDLNEGSTIEHKISRLLLQLTVLTPALFITVFRAKLFASSIQSDASRVIFSRSHIKTKDYVSYMKII